jgi:para-nitrobenzyl esterase
MPSRFAPLIAGSLLLACDTEPSGVAASLLEPAQEPLVVQTLAGTVRGVAAGPVERFLGIPYAAPPLADLRWAPPVPPQPWTGERDASQVGPICLQPGPLGAPIGSEDCLSLNVYRPAELDPSERLPVMLWIHGGSFVSGAGSIYDPQRLVAENQIVVVTINYRLGALGFLAAPALTSESEDAVSGDYGLMDQTLALRWVRDNIAAFGGDPARVTIDGQSAGGASVCAQLAAPAAGGLFTAAIIQSASCASVALALAEVQGTALAGALGCSDAASAAACLRALPAERLVGLNAVFGPVAGGTYLPLAPYAALLGGQQHAVPLLVGGVSDEMRGFAALEYPLDPAQYLDALAAHFPAESPEAIAALYPLEAYAEPYLALTAALSDSGSYLLGSLGGCVTEALADTASASTPTWTYEFDDPGFIWSASALPVPVPNGASHSSELPFLFDTVGVTLNEPFDPDQEALAEQMLGAWGAFIRGGDPNPGGTGVQAWPSYDVQERRMLHLEPGKVGVVTDFRERHHCEFWQTSATAAAAARAAAGAN